MFVSASSSDGFIPNGDQSEMNGRTTEAAAGDKTPTGIMYPPDAPFGFVPAAVEFIIVDGPNKTAVFR